MHLHLFGAATPAGEAFYRQVCRSSPWSITQYSRSCSSMMPLDFNCPASFNPGGQFGAPSVWISFGPIWLLSPFLKFLANHLPGRLHGLRGVIACSSSSAVTKRFASNKFDRDLVARLTHSEDQLLTTCQSLNLPCRILRPTLIYGRVGSYGDRNLSRLIRLMRRSPFLPVPIDSGLRQPIHAIQVAAVTFKLVNQLVKEGFDSNLPQCIGIGGDSELSYTNMLKALQQVLPNDDPARRCILFPVSTRLFHASAAPLLLSSPKAFESVLRISADLSGFIPSHHLLNTEPEPFPILPIL